jgi:hypothetical protein
MHDALEELIGNRVQVYSNSGDDGCDDTGILEGYEFPFLYLRKGKDDLFCFSVFNVRLVKLVKRMRPPSDPRKHLLRPAEIEESKALTELEAIEQSARNQIGTQS